MPVIAVIEAALLVLVPSVVPRTVSVITHVWPAFTAMAEAVKGSVLSTAVKAGVPHWPFVVGTGGLAMTRPAGKASVKDSPERLTALVPVLAIEKAKVVVWPMPIALA